jgi:hypothetical protein
MKAPDGPVFPTRDSGVFSEQRFRLRRPAGILTGTIDKLLIFRDKQTQELSAEIIDFKTSRFRAPMADYAGADRGTDPDFERTAGRRRKDVNQLAFEFSSAAPKELLVRLEAEEAAADYRLQMQAYALAVRELAPEVGRIQVTLHFLDPNIEVTMGNESLGPEACAKAVDQAAEAMLFSRDPASFPVNPADHCRTCNFLRLCPAGRRLGARGKS